MAIKKIKITNFKSFNDLEIALGNFNILIGVNASGKSNFIQLFKFLKDIADNGLENAISMQGGVEYLRNVNIGSSKNFSLEVVSDIEEASKMFKNARTGALDIEGKTYEVIYKFDINFSEKNSEFEIYEDRIIEKCKFFKLEKDVGRGEITLSNINGNVQHEFKDIPAEIVSGREDNFLPAFLMEALPLKTLLLQTPFAYRLNRSISDVSIYDFDPKEPKKATPSTGKAELEEDGSNLALILKHIIADGERKRKFDNLIKYLLPLVKNVDIEFANQYLHLKLQETYSKDYYLPTFLLSDGTIRMTALIIALYFEKRHLTIIEEPERNIHPYLISKVVKMMKEASQKKQIIVTTHNSEIVKYADLEDILLISRDKEGFSTISRPCEKEEIKTFLKNEIGIEELYTKKLLEM